MTTNDDLNQVTADVKKAVEDVSNLAQNIETATKLNLLGDVNKVTTTVKQDLQKAVIFVKINKVGLLQLINFVLLASVLVSTVCHKSKPVTSIHSNIKHIKVVHTKGK